MTSTPLTRMTMFLTLALGGCYGVPQETDSDSQALLYCEQSNPHLTNLTRVCHHALNNAAVYHRQRLDPVTSRFIYCDAYCRCGYNYTGTTDTNGNPADLSCSPGVTPRSDRASEPTNPTCAPQEFSVPYMLNVPMRGRSPLDFRACREIGSDAACAVVCNQRPTLAVNVSLACCMPTPPPRATSSR